jgi:amidohydrolase
MIEKARAISPQLSLWRRDFHKNPELGFHEERTAFTVGSILEGIGCRVKRGIGRTGILADLGSGDPCIAIRADMDALPIQELTSAEYASLIPGVMHACGHDAHMACALGAATLLSAEKFTGTVRFVFQPSEETGDEKGCSGAPLMIQDGALEQVSAIIALHVESGTPWGAIRTESGPASGGVDSWFAEILGLGGHGAYPNQTIDPFFLLAQVINALNSIVSRRLYPFHPAVISIGSIHGGDAENVIPDRVKVTGTLRYTEKDVRDQLRLEIQRAFQVTQILGGNYELHFQDGSPPMINNPEVTQLITSVGYDLLGDANVLPWRRELGAEDFGCYLGLIPGSMFTLGVQGEKESPNLHNSRFDIDERCLPIGTAILAETALRYLRLKTR